MPKPTRKTNSLGQIPETLTDDSLDESAKNSKKAPKSALDSFEELGFYSKKPDMPNVFSTGLFPLDYVTGGGFREGKLTIVAGEIGSGKTNLVSSAIKGWLDKWPNKKVLLLDVERSFSAVTLKRSGLQPYVDNGNLFIQSQAQSEILANAVISLLKQHNDIGLIVIDTISNMVSSEAVARDVGDNKVAVGKVSSNMFIRLLHDQQALRMRDRFKDASVSPLTLLLVAHVPISMDKYSGWKISAPTSASQLADTIVSLKRMRFMTEEETATKDIDDERKNQVIECGLVLKKIRDIEANREVSFSIISDPNHDEYGTFNNVSFLFAKAKKLGIITGMGNNYKIPALGIEGLTKDELAAYIRDNRGVYNVIAARLCSEVRKKFNEDETLPPDNYLFEFWEGATDLGYLPEEEYEEEPEVSSASEEDTKEESL